MAFCDFCTCEDCRDGRDDLSHAQTTDGRWICDICYWYECCIDAKQKAGVRGGPCKKEHCRHRPKLTTTFTKHTKGTTP